MIEISTIVIQIVLVEIGGEAVKTSHLTPYQHGLCIVIGFGSIIIGLLLKAIPRSLFDFKLNEKPMSNLASMKSLMHKIRKANRGIERKLTRIGSEKNLGFHELEQIQAFKSMKTFKY
jgi:P-type Ca2+ transporter type 2B